MVGRLAHEATRAQYEIPGFTAGMVVGLLRRILWLLDRRAERYGEDPLLREVRAVCRRAIEYAERWMSEARMVTDYDAAREAVEREAR